MKVELRQDARQKALEKSIDKAEGTGKFDRQRTTGWTGKAKGGNSGIQ